MKLKLLIFSTIIGIGIFSYFIGESLSEYARYHRDWYEIIPDTNVLVRIHNTYPNDSRGYRIKLEFYNPNSLDAEIRGFNTEVIHTEKEVPISTFGSIHVRAKDNRTITFFLNKSDIDPEYLDYYANEIIWKEPDKTFRFYSINKHSLYDELLYILFKIFRYTDYSEF